MNPDLVDEIEYMIDLLTKSGFFFTEGDIGNFRRSVH